ncbi:MAG TPA: serine/threonine-protein kinase [Trueperaceae bacterium]|nr:serine/threonine-protein kinase [Trueperaceae bacterium]
MSAENDGAPFVPEGYRVLHKLGSGQTSHVYLAQHAEFGRVALKVPREELHQNPVLRRMFENEVQITLKLSHPNIVAAFDGFPTGPGAFLSLELCGGGTLDQLLLEKGKLSLDRAYGVVAEVGRGLAHAHQRKVLHRDVKPANVFLTDDGVAKLGDFGSGVFQGESSQDRVGTAFYMAPEVFEGTPSSARTDIYSLGVLAYEVLAGERPFVGESYESLMLAHLSGIPRDLRVLRPDVPRDIVRVVNRAMARDADRRFGSVSEFVNAFVRSSGRDEPGPGEMPLRTGRASRLPRASEPAADEAAEDRGRERSEERGGLLAWLRKRRN